MRILLILLFLFFISVAVRAPALNRPLSKHHEFCTAIALRILQNWNEKGISFYRFQPVMNFSGSANKFINNHASGSGEMIDSAGNFYYVSHPPLAYYLPFVVFKLFGIFPDVLSIQIFNLLIHFLAAAGIFLITRTILPQNIYRIATITAFVFYLFTPATLWFHSNVYMADMLVQLFFIYAIFFLLKFLSDENSKWLLLTAIFSFLMCYTSWLGYFFAAAVMAGAAFRFFGKKNLQILFSIGMTSFIAFAITVLQYTQIAGFDALKAEWFHRFAERSFGAGAFVQSFFSIGKNYITSYFPLLLILLVAIIFFRNEIKKFFSERLKTFFYLSLMPVVLLHFVLSDYSGHDFTTLYGSVFLCVTTGLIAHFSAFQKRPTVLKISVAIICIFCIAQFYFINRPGEISLSGERYDTFKKIGLAIKQEAADDEMIFLLKEKPSPEIVFYAQRNIQQVNDPGEELMYLLNNNQKKGVIFHVEKGNAKVVKRINLDE